MSWNPTSPLTGGPQTGLTSPTYTLVSDSYPGTNGVQHVVSALGGTQSGVEAHTLSKPFTLTCVRPKLFKLLGTANPVTGVISNVPMNTWKVITRKGVSPQSGQPNRVMLITTTISCPAGADVADAANVRAALSVHCGALWNQSDELGDAQIDGVL